MCFPAERPELDLIWASIAFPSQSMGVKRPRWHERLGRRAGKQRNMEKFWWIHWQQYTVLRLDLHKYLRCGISKTHPRSTPTILTLPLITQGFQQMHYYSLFPETAAEIQASDSSEVNHSKVFHPADVMMIRKWYIRVYSLWFYTSFKMFHLLFFSPFLFFFSFCFPVITQSLKDKRGNSFCYFKYLSQALSLTLSNACSVLKKCTREKIPRI